MPRMLFPYERDIRNIIGKRINRGRVFLSHSEKWVDERRPNIRLDYGKAMQYAAVYRELKDKLDLSGELRLEHLLNIEDLFSPREDESFRASLWELTRNALERALDELITVSRREGGHLAADLGERIDTVHMELDRVKARAGGQVSRYRERLNDRLRELLDDDSLDRNRLETEIALMADRLDISEELVRLESHLELFRATLRREEPMGKTLGFILQEMGREVNTIASKCWDVEIAQAGIRMKETLEQIREQVQNIE